MTDQPTSARPAHVASKPPRRPRLNHHKPARDLSRPHTARHALVGADAPLPAAAPSDPDRHDR